MKLEQSLQFPLNAPILVREDVFVYPFMIVPIFISEESNIQAVNKAMSENELLSVHTLQENGQEIHEVGVLGSIVRKVALPDGRVKLLFQGTYRVKIVKIIAREPLEASLDILKYKPYEQKYVDASLEILREKVRLLASNNQNFSQEFLRAIDENYEPNRVVDLVASSMKLKREQAYNLFVLTDVLERVEMLIEYVLQEIEVQNIQKELNTKVHAKMEQINKEYFLKEHMKLIQKELGNDTNKDEEIAKYFEKLESLKSYIYEDTYKEIHKQIRRLSNMHQESADANLLNSYIEWCLDIPFDKSASCAISIGKISTQLNKDHFSLDKPKERILEYFAVRELSEKRQNTQNKGTILCFYGPPGVGKTSLANSIAKATKRALVRIALGGMEDISELRGHRRTYVGAMPGRIVQGLIEAKEMNPVVVLDEIDKVGKSYRGDPASVLLEILDPEQNNTFRDYYTNFNIDLSQVIFIATANDVGNIPPALRDRMEFIELSSYTPREKFEIARKYLVPQELKKHSLKPSEVSISSKALQDIIEKYTREAGVRSLRRQIATIMRKSVKEILGSKITKVTITPHNINLYLDKIVFESKDIESHNRVGITNGLAWTAVGGDVLKIEAIKIKGKGALMMTGSLGDVMKESAHIAHSVVKMLFSSKFFTMKRSELKKLSKNKVDQIYDYYDIHLHVPEGATPKDGPSAGITMACTIASILTDRYVDSSVAMTGELTLSGSVLPIGGLKEKVIAAYKAGIKKVIIPAKNYERDLCDIDEEIQKGMQIIAVNTIKEVLDIALL